jgi:hypothetical protein
VRSQIPEYNINNFGADWSSGRAICSLAEVIQPGQMNLPGDWKNDAVYNCQLGMTSCMQGL